MKLKDLKVGDKFMYVDNDALPDIYVVKQIYEKKGFYLVGKPGVYDVFADFPETEVISEK